jgi:hypothetical protein
MTRTDLKKLQGKCEGCGAENLYDLIKEKERIGHPELIQALEKRSRAWANNPNKGDGLSAVELALKLLKTPEDKAQYDDFLKRDGQPQPAVEPSRSAEDQPRRSYRDFGPSPFERWAPRVILVFFVVVVLVGLQTLFSPSPDPTVTGGAGPTGPTEDKQPWEIEDELALDGAARCRIQTGLSAAGFSPGPVDGVFGSRTRDALREWQGQMGVSRTGFLTSTTAELLEELAREVGEPVEDGATGIGEVATHRECATSGDPSVPVVDSTVGLTGRWFGRVEGSGGRYYVDIIFGDDGARIRYPLQGCSGRLHFISGASYREELVEGQGDCAMNGRVTLRRLTTERVSYEWGYDSRSVEASGQLMEVAVMAEGGDELELAGTWRGEHGYTRYPSNEYSAGLTIEPTGVVLRIEWPCVFRLEPVSADSQRLVYSAVVLDDGLCNDGGVTIRRLGRKALWFETEWLEYYGTMVGILRRGFD